MPSFVSIIYSSISVSEFEDVLGNFPGHYFVELQIRTIAMDFWASLEHQIYYKKGHDAIELREELKNCAEVSAALDLRMQNIRAKINEE